MAELIVKVKDEKTELIEQVLKEMGCEVKKTNMKVTKRKKNKLTSISPTFLFGKWKDLDIDPITYRDKLWKRN